MCPVCGKDDHTITEWLHCRDEYLRANWTEEDQRLWDVLMGARTD